MGRREEERRGKGRNKRMMVGGYRWATIKSKRTIGSGMCYMLIKIEV